LDITTVRQGIPTFNDYGIMFAEPGYDLYPVRGYQSGLDPGTVRFPILNDKYHIPIEKCRAWYDQDSLSSLHFNMYVTKCTGTERSIGITE